MEALTYVLFVTEVEAALFPCSNAPGVHDLFSYVDLKTSHCLKFLRSPKCYLSRVHQANPFYDMQKIWPWKICSFDI